MTDTKLSDSLQNKNHKNTEQMLAFLPQEWHESQTEVDKEKQQATFLQLFPVGAEL